MHLNFAILVLQIFAIIVFFHNEYRGKEGQEEDMHDSENQENLATDGCPLVLDIASNSWMDYQFVHSRCSHR